jgi:hypothetical protein
VLQRAGFAVGQAGRVRVVSVESLELHRRQLKRHVRVVSVI